MFSIKYKTHTSDFCFNWSFCQFLFQLAFISFTEEASINPYIRRMDVISPFVKRQAIIADYQDLFLKEDVAEYESLDESHESAIVNEANLLSGQTLRKLLINTDPATIQPYEKREASPYNSVEKRNALNQPLMKKREAMVFCADICDDSNYSR